MKKVQPRYQGSYKREGIAFIIADTREFDGTHTSFRLSLISILKYLNQFISHM